MFQPSQQEKESKAPCKLQCDFVATYPAPDQLDENVFSLPRSFFQARVHKATLFAVAASRLAQLDVGYIVVLIRTGAYLVDLVCR